MKNTNNIISTWLFVEAAEKVAHNEHEKHQAYDRMMQCRSNCDCNMCPYIYVCPKSSM